MYTFADESLFASPEATFSVGDLLRAVSAHKLTVVCGLLAGIIGGCLLVRVVPVVYSAEADLVAEPAETQAAVLGVSGPLMPPDPAVTRTVVETLESNAIIARAIQQLPPEIRAYLISRATKRGMLSSLCRKVATLLATARAFQQIALQAPNFLCRTLLPEDGNTEAALGGTPLGATTESAMANWRLRQVTTYISKNLSVENTGQSYIIHVHDYSPRADVAAALANAIANAYLDYLAQQKTEDKTTAIANLQGKLGTLGPELNAQELRTQELREQVQLQDLRSGALNDQQTAALMSQLTEARLRRTQAEARLNAALKAHGDPTGSNLPDVLNSQLIQQLREQQAQLQQTLAQLMTRFGPTHPNVRSVRYALRDAQQSIARESARIVASLQAGVDTARAQEEGIVQTLRRQEREIGRSARADTNLREAERRTQAIAAEYNYFLQRQRELTGLQDLPGPNTRLLAAAQAPLKPTGRNTPALVGLGSITGLLAGTSIAVFRHRRARGSGPLLLSQMARRDALDVSFIPRIAPLRDTLARYASEHPSAPIAEALHRTRAFLRMRFDGMQRRVLMVASALPGDGKTSFCLALANMMAMAGETVVVVDCDLRKPPSTQAVPGGRGGALHDYSDLNAIVDWGETGQPSLVRFGANRPPPHAALSSPSFKALLGWLSARFDYVILDTPPLSLAADTLFVGYHADDCLVVTKWKAAHSNLLRGTIEDIRSRGIRVSGLVVNQAQPTANLLATYRLRAAFAGGFNTAHTSALAVDLRPLSDRRLT